MNTNLDTIFQTATPGPVTDTIKWLVDNRILRLTDFTTKFGDYIPFDFRIDKAGNANSIDSIGERLADRVIEIENELGTQFDSMLCSLYSGIFGGVGTSLWLKRKYNRNMKIAVSRRTYNQKGGVDAWSIHPLKEKDFVGELGNNVLIHDEMTNTGNTVSELIDLCNERHITPRATMLIADRILDPLPEGSHIRIINSVPCYSLITHYEIVDWCKNNPDIWRSLYEKSS